MNDKPTAILLSCRRKSQKRKDMWYCSQTGDIEEKEKKQAAFQTLRRLQRAHGQNGNEPQGWLCFAGHSSGCENLWNKASLNYLSQCPDSTGLLRRTAPLSQRGAAELRGPNSGCLKPCASLCVFQDGRGARLVGTRGSGKQWWLLGRAHIWRRRMVVGRICSVSQVVLRKVTTSLGTLENRIWPHSSWGMRSDTGLCWWWSSDFKFVCYLY